MDAPITLKYPWNVSTIGVIFAICIRMAFTIFIASLMFLTVAWFLILALFAISTLIAAHDFYMMITKAPVCIELRNDQIDCRFSFGRRITLKYENIVRLAYESSRRRLSGFAAKLIVSPRIELFIEPTTMKNFSSLVKILIEKNKNCKIDSYFKEMTEASPRA